MPARIEKIKQTDGRIVIRLSEGKGSRTEKETVLKSAEDPHPDLIEAFRALVPHARDILEWPDTYAEGRVKVMGVSFSLNEETGVEGAVMTGQVLLDTTDAPFLFNTPHLPFDQYSHTGGSKLMPTAAQAALQTLREEAEAFLSGKRLQGDLFPKTAKSNAGKMAAAEQGAG